MPYLIVFGMACGVGVAVYAITLRSAVHQSSSLDDPVLTVPSGPPTYLGDDERPDWQQRLTGLLGLVVAVVVGGIALAMTLYLSVSTGLRLLTE